MATKSKNAGKSAAYHHGNLKQELVSAGRRLLERRGVEGLSLRGVAREAGVSQAAPYHHFEDKDGLLAAIAAEGFAGLSAEMARQSAGAETPGGHMGGLGSGYIVFAFENPELFRLMHGPRFAVADKYDDLLTIAADSFMMLRDGVAACRPGASDEEIEMACHAAWSLVHGASMLIVDKRIDAGSTRHEIVAFANQMTSQLPVSG
ncbi:MAG: TetR/AcrR family transcriptional regulator [Candidatus Phaeomarinobacter sp.]